MWTMAPSVILKYIFIESVDRLWNKFCITVIQKKKKKAGNSKWILCDSLGKSVISSNVQAFSNLKGMAENLNKGKQKPKHSKNRIKALQSRNKVELMSKVL